MRIKKDVYEETDFFDNEVSPVLKGTAVTGDYTAQETDHSLGCNTSNGSLVLTFPDANSIAVKPRLWRVKKMLADDNVVTLKLAVPGDSMYGEHFHSMNLTQQGQGVEVILNVDNKYLFSDWSGIEPSLYTAHPVVTTQTPSLSDTTLTMSGNLESLGSFSTVNVYFRYRDVTNNGSWIETTKNEQTATGSFSDTATVTAGNVYEVQAVVDDDIDTHYGAVLQTTANYYSSVTEAANDGLERYWPMQEINGIDLTAAETMAGDDMSMYNGVTVGSDTINSNTIYKRIFGTGDYGQAGYQPNWTYSGGSKTILLQMKNNSSSGDHTMLNFGRNVLSIGSDGSGVQLEVNNNISTWSSATPFSGILNIFITVDRGVWKTTLYTCTSAIRTERTYQWAIPDNQAANTRLARGASGDANHQDYEYLDDGEVRSIAVWGRILTESEMKDICGILDNDGGLIVS